MLRVAAWVCAALLATEIDAQSDKWTEWESCGSAASQSELEVSMRISSDGRGLQGTALDPGEQRMAHQLVFLNNYTGKLEVNHEATVWEELMHIEDEVNVIVMYGYYGRGRSTLASMLGCAMNNASDSTTVFPAQRIVESIEPGGNIGFPHTLGIWASDPFVYHGPDGEGPPRTFLIVDTQGLDHKHQIVPGLSRKIMNDAAIKIIAMLTEVASEFIYVSSDRHAELGSTDYNNLGLAFKTTRESLVKSSEEWELSEEEQELNIRSINHPGLLFVTRETIETDIVNAEEFSFDSGTWGAYAANNYGSLAGDAAALKALIDSNFKAHTVATNAGDAEIGWLYNPFPEMSQQLDGDNMFAWTEKKEPYELEQGASCRVYRAMSSGAWACRRKDGNNDDSPTAPPTFKLMLDNLAKEIHAHAPVRQVAWGSSSRGLAVAPQNLTGARLKGFMEASVTEINKAGPVADNELWRLIMEDRCSKDLHAMVDKYYVGKYSELDEQAYPARMGQLDEHETAQLNATFIAAWTTTIEQFDTVVDDFFLKEPLLVGVKEECKAFAYTTMSKLDQRAQRLFAEMGVLGEQAITNRLEEERAAVEAELAAALKEIDDLWLQANLPYIIAFVALGVGAVSVLSSMCGQVRATSRACCACCVDLSSKDTDYKVTHIVQNADGVELSNRSGGEGLLPPPTHAPMGYNDPELTSRLEQLEDVVLQLAARVPQRDLQAMGMLQYAAAAPARLPDLDAGAGSLGASVGPNGR